MDSPSAGHRARERLIADRTNKLSAYFIEGRGNWLGQVLKSMCGVVQANFDPRNSIQMRRGVVQEYLDFMAAPDFGPIAERDLAFKAVLAFAEIFGAFVDEMNERTIEGQSMLFQPARPESFGDTVVIAGEVRGNRAVSSPAAVGDDSFTKLRASGGQENMTPSLDLVRSSSGRFVSRSSIAVTPVVGRRAAVDNDDGNQPGARKRARGDKVVAISPATNPHQLVAQQRLPATARRRSSNEANFDSTASSVVACAVCGAKVKEGVMRRHMKGHAAGVGMEVAFGGDGAAAAAAAAAAAEEEPPSLLDEKETSSEEAGGAAAEDLVEPQPPAKKLPMEQNVVLNEFGLEEESADEEEMEVEEGGEAADSTTEDLDGWAADLYNKAAACFLCNKACGNYKRLSTHLYGSHKGFSRNHFAFQCLGCSHKFRSFFGALGHIQAAFRNKLVGCKNKVTFVTSAMRADIKEESPEDAPPPARKTM